MGAGIVLVNWRDPWHHLAGGSERYAWQFALALREAGANVEFWTARDRGQVAREVRQGIALRRRGGRYAFYGRALAGLLWRRVRRRAPDLVVDMDCGIPVFSPLVLSRDTPVLLVIHHVHQEQFRTAMRRPLSDLGRFLEARAMPRVYQGASTVAVSDSTVGELRSQLGWSGPVQVLHNGTDPVATPAGLDHEPELERVLVFGRMVAHKRVDQVLRAIAEVRPGRPQLRADLVGTGPEIARLTALITDLGLDDIVEVHGFVAEDAKAEILGRARVHVCASDAEGWGQVVLEAAAHGIPTLGRDVPGVRDSVKDGRTGWLIPEPTTGRGSRLVEDLAAGIEASLDRLGEPAERVRIAEQCRAWSAEFGWDRMRREAVHLAASTLRTTG